MNPMRCRIQALDGGPARVDVYDDIGPGGWFADGLTAKDFSASLSQVRGPVDVHINSAGGDVSDGIAIANAIRAHKGFKRTVVDGMAASIASVIFQAGNERVVEPGSMVMIHDPFTGLVGNADELRQTADVLDKHGDNLAKQYADRAGGTPEQWRDVMKAETWYTADEAVAAGLADKVGSGSAALPDGLDLAAFVSVPGRIAAALRTMPRAAAPEPYDGDGKCPTCKGKKTIRGGAMTCPDCKGTGKAPAAGDAADREPGPHAAAPGAETPVCRTCEGRGTVKHPSTGQNTMQCPGCKGTGLYDPPDESDSDGAADNRARGPLANMSFAELRSALRDEVTDGLRAAGLFLRADGKVDNSPWDSSKAWAAGVASDDPAAFYKGICAGEKSDGDPATQAHWALPYKYAPGDPPNADAVKNALARLPQTEGLTNGAAAKKTLQAAMKQVNPDYEAPEDSTDTVFSQRLREMRGAMPPLKGADA